MFFFIKAKIPFGFLLVSKNGDECRSILKAVAYVNFQKVRDTCPLKAGPAQVWVGCGERAGDSRSSSQEAVSLGLNVVVPPGPTYFLCSGSS